MAANEVNTRPRKMKEASRIKHGTHATHLPGLPKRKRPTWERPPDPEPFKRSRHRPCKTPGNLIDLQSGSRGRAVYRQGKEAGEAGIQMALRAPPSTVSSFVRVPPRVGKSSVLFQISCDVKGRNRWQIPFAAPILLPRVYRTRVLKGCSDSKLLLNL